ncbi:MAG: sirohydrochlorin cobaltochelatase [Eubacteriales bacterium]|nr:sirohydrochlorin cobaltochelatase [Eubacteriales bacterium]
MSRALLMISFGTRVPEARESIEQVERALQHAAPGLHVCRAFTSPTIRRILAKRGEMVPSLSEALASLEKQGVTEIIIQPTHMLYGFEYDKIKETVQQFENRIPDIRLGKPLLAGSADLRRLADVLMEQYPAREDEALLLMGHGTEHFANAVYPALQTAFCFAGRTDILVGTVEGWPSIDDIKTQLKKRGYHKAHLVPLMLVAGDHAKNDMAGAHPDSWKSQLEADGVSVRCTIRGLGVLPEIQRMYADHLSELLR